MEEKIYVVMLSCPNGTNKEIESANKTILGANKVVVGVAEALKQEVKYDKRGAAYSKDLSVCEVDLDD